MLSAATYRPEVVIGIGAALLLGGVLASRVSSRIGVPVLLLFLGVGMLAGSEGPGGIHFDDAQTAQLVGIVALVLILFSGGLSTPWDHVRGAIGPAAWLSTVGVVITAAVSGLCATWLLGLPVRTGMLLGAIISSTDAAAVFSVLRGSKLDLRPPLDAVLELESGGNDPMAVFLTLSLIDVISHPDQAILPLLGTLVLEVVVGGLCGYGAARLGRWVINRIALDFDGLYPVLTLAVAFLSYAIATLLHGSGFLCVYIAGIALANGDLLHKRSISRFHDAIAWLAQIAMFVVLGLLVFPSRLVAVAGRSLVIAFVLIVLARPLAALVALVTTRLGMRDRLFLSWVGLRGAVPIVLATFPLVSGIRHADLIFDVVFFVVITSVLVQGATTPWVAKRLGVLRPRTPTAATT